MLGVGRRALGERVSRIVGETYFFHADTPLRAKEYLLMASKILCQCDFNLIVVNRRERHRCFGVRDVLGCGENGVSSSQPLLRVGLL